MLYYSEFGKIKKSRQTSKRKMRLKKTKTKKSSKKTKKKSKSKSRCKFGLDKFGLCRCGPGKQRNPATNRCVMALGKKFKKVVKKVVKKASQKFTTLAKLLKGTTGYHHYQGMRMYLSPWIKYMKHQHKQLCASEYRDILWLNNVTFSKYEKAYSKYASDDPDEFTYLKRLKKNLIRSSNLYFAKETLDYLKECIDDKKRFFIAFLIIHKRHVEEGKEYYTGHANSFIFDLQKKLLYRWEPHGTFTDYYSHIELDKDIRKSLEQYGKKYKFLKNYEYIEPLQYCPKLDLQTLEAIYATKNVKKIKGEADGFCAAWSALFMHYTILNPDLDVRELRNKIERTPKKLAHEIRQYMAFIVKLSKKYT